MDMGVFVGKERSVSAEGSPEDVDVAIAVVVVVDVVAVVGGLWCWGTGAVEDRSIPTDIRRPPADKDVPLPEIPIPTPPPAVSPAEELALRKCEISELTDRGGCRLTEEDDLVIVVAAVALGPPTPIPPAIGTAGVGRLVIAVVAARIS